MYPLPSGLTQLRLLLGLAIRRELNRAFAGFAAIRSSRKAARSGIGPARGARPPTPRRRIGTGLILAFLIAMTTLSVALFSWRFLTAIPVEEALRSETFTHLESLEKKSSGGRESVSRQAVSVIRADPAIETLPQQQQLAATSELTRRWVAQGSLKGSDFGTPESALNYPALHERIQTFAGLAFLLILLWILATSLGMATQNPGRVESGTLWLTSMPLPGRVLFSAVIVEYALVNPFFWQSVWPFLTLCAISVGHGWASPFLALLICLPVAAALAAIRLAVETWSRMRLTHARRKDIQVVSTLIGMLLMLGLYGMMLGEPLPAWARTLASAVPWADLPSGWPVRAALGPGSDALPWLAASGAFSLMLAAASAAYCAWSVRGGFLTDPGTLQSDRRSRLWPHAKGWPPLSLLHKDLMLLRRDRALLFQVLALPVFIIGLQFVVNPGMADVVAGSFRHACTLAFVLGTYVLLFSATGVLNAEGAALWLITSAPHPLARLLLQKVALWTGLAMIYALTAVALAVAVTPWPGASGLSDAVMVLVGVPVFAVIAAGMGAASSDPLAVEPQQRMDTAVMVSLMLIMTMYAQAIYTTHAHFRLLWIMLTCVLAYALWQQLEERLPWLLDPIDRPPRRLGLSDGALAAMGFMCICGFLSLLLSVGDLSPALVQLIAYSGAGVLVALTALWTLWRSGLVGMLRSTGLRPGAGWRQALPANLAWGVAGGLAAALVGTGYLALLRHFPLFQLDASATEVPLGVLFALVAIAAPLAEEFIFRGLLFAGLRSTLPVVWAIPASAAIFALIHPTVAIVPVFVVGCITALTYHRTGWLLAPILVHGIYNATLILL